MKLNPIKLLAVLLFLLNFPISAQAIYPNKTITLIVPYDAGGGIDRIARLIAQELSTRFSESVIVENRGGASNTIGMNIVAKAKPDGYTLGLATRTFLMTPYVIKKHPYDPLNDFLAVAMIGESPLALVVSSSVPVNNLKEFVSYAKTNPNKLNWASLGMASTQGLAGIEFNLLNQIEATQISYKGTSQAVQDILAGNVQYMFNPLISILPQMSTGKIKILGLTGTKRLAQYPDIPLIADSISNFDSGAWSGIVAPAKTPPAIINRLNLEINQILASSLVQEALITGGVTPKAITPKQFEKILELESTNNAKIFPRQLILE